MAKPVKTPAPAAPAPEAPPFKAEDGVACIVMSPIKFARKRFDIGAAVTLPTDIAEELEALGAVGRTPSSLD